MLYFVLFGVWCSLVTVWSLFLFCGIQKISHGFETAWPFWGELSLTFLLERCLYYQRVIFLVLLIQTGLKHILFKHTVATEWPNGPDLCRCGISAPTPAITVNQPSAHCIINRWSVSVARITRRLFTCETRRHGCRNDGVMEKVKWKNFETMTEWEQSKFTALGSQLCNYTH